MESSLHNLAPEILLYLMSFLPHEVVGRVRLLSHTFKQLVNRETQDLVLREIYRRLTLTQAQQRLIAKVFSPLMVREVKAFIVIFHDEPCTEIYRCLLSPLNDEETFLSVTQYLSQGHQLDVVAMALLLRLPHTLLHVYLSSLNGWIDKEILDQLIPHLCDDSSDNARLSLFALRAGKHFSSMSQIRSISLSTFEALIASGYRLPDHATLLRWCYHSPRLRGFLSEVDSIRGALKPVACPFVGQYIMYKLCFFSLELGYQLRPELSNHYNYSGFSRIWYGLPFVEKACPHRELSVNFSVLSSVRRKKEQWVIKREEGTHIHIPLIYLEGFATCALLFFPCREFRHRVLHSPLSLEKYKAPSFPNLKEGKVSTDLGYLVVMSKHRVYFSTQDVSSFPYPHAGDIPFNLVRGAYLFCYAFSLPFDKYCEVFV